MSEHKVDKVNKAKFPVSERLRKAGQPPFEEGAQPGKEVEKHTVQKLSNHIP